VNDRPSAIDSIESLNPDWALVAYALVIMMVGAWLVWKYADK
jgi:hypothetical protein